MAKDCSFDVVSEVDMQEVDNAVNQAKKEIGTRYDFRGSKAEISLEGDTIKIIGDDEYKLNAIIDVLKGKMVKRNVAIKNLDYGKVEPAAGATVRQIITIKKGITKENAKEVVKAIKNMKIKVQASIQEDQVRVSGKDKDDSVADTNANDKIQSNHESSNTTFDRLEDFVSGIGDVPKIIADIFSFLPSWCLDLIGIGFALLMILIVVKFIRG